MEPRADLQRRIAALSPAEQEELLRRLEKARGATAVMAAEITRRPVTRAPLSFAQQRLWFLDQLHPGSPHYNVATVAPIQGPLDPSVLQKCLDELVRRHEALRTTFELDEADTPVQVIHERIEVPLDQVDLSGLESLARAAAVDASVTELACKTMDLATGPLVSARLIRLASDEHVLATSMHHIITDLWSIEILLRELAVIYPALLHGRPVPLAEPRLQYTDFTLWQREWLRGEVLDRQTEYWRGQLAGDLPPLELPTDRPRPVQQDFRGAHYVHRLPAELSHRLDRLCVAEKTTPFALFLTVVGTLLYRYTGQTDIVVGAPVSNRSRAELEGTVGYLGNTLVLRLDFSGNPTFREAIRRTRQVTLDAFANQDLPLEKVVEIAQPQRDLSGTPLLQVVFVYHTPTEPEAGDQRPQGLGDTLPVDNGTTKFDLTFGLVHSPGSHRLTLEYSTEMFDASTIERLGGHWETMLAGIVADPDARIGSLPLLTAGERSRMLVDWNATQAPFPEHSCLHELIDEQARRTPDAVAATGQGGPLTYSQLCSRANRLAHGLRELGVGPDVPVAVCLDKSVDVAVGLLAVLKAGGAYLPLDGAMPSAHVATLLADARAPILLAHGHLADRFESACDVRPVLLDRDWPTIDELPDTPPEVGAQPHHLAYLIYTSGSTGRPKGVMLDHRGRVNNFHDFNTRYSVGPGDCVLGLAALNFDMSAYDVLGTLMSGARVAFPDPSSGRDPAHWLDVMLRERVSVWHSVPALLEMLVGYAESEGHQSLPDLRLVLLGGDWVPTTLPGRIRALAPSARVVCMGGATEVSMDSTLYEPEEFVAAARSIRYGRPMANQRAYLLDTHLQPVPVGVVGELYLAGIGVGRGYVGDPELTAAKFLDPPLPEEPGRVYRTGDLCRYHSDGNLELLGRADFQVKIRGWRIEPGHIQQILREHPAVRESVVVAHTGSGGVKRLIAYVIPTADDLDPAALLDWARGRLPEYLVPSAVVQLDRFPLTANGKVDRHSLPAPPLTAATTTGYVAPRADDERVLAEVWQELLGAERVGIDDNFFALGGDSIQTIQVIARAKKRGLLLQPKQLFRCQTIRELAAVAGATEATAEATPHAREPLLGIELLARLRQQHPDLEDAYALTPMQSRMLRHAVEQPVEGLYVIHAALLFTAGGIDVELLVQAWQTVIDRYPILRTSFAWEGLAEPVQIVHQHAQLLVERHDLRGLNAEEQLRRQDEVVLADRQRGFDLRAAPLVRLHLLRLDDDTYRYLSSNHHIVLDGWSRAIVQQEVFAVYEALRRGRSAELPPFRPFRDYVGWVRAQEPARAEQTWRTYLDGFNGPTPIVAARGLPDPCCDGPFVKQSVRMTPESARALTAFTRSCQVTANAVMQGAWMLLMARYTGQRDLVLGVMSSGRLTELLDVETVVGVCCNALPVRARLDPSERLGSWLARLQQEQVELRELDHTPQEAIQGWLGLTGPLFECLMVFENYPWDGSLDALSDLVDITHPLAQRDYQVAQFEYPLRVEVEPKASLLIMHYYRRAFSDETVADMIGDWARMIERMSEDPGRALSELIAC